MIADVLAIAAVIFLVWAAVAYSRRCDRRYAEKLRRRFTSGTLSGLALLQIDPDEPIVTTPRGVELDLGDLEDWTVGDVARVIETIEAL